MGERCEPTVIPEIQRSRWSAEAACSFSVPTGDINSKQCCLSLTSVVVVLGVAILRSGMITSSTVSCFGDLMLEISAPSRSEIHRLQTNTAVECGHVGPRGQVQTTTARGGVAHRFQDRKVLFSRLNRYPADIMFVAMLCALHPRFSASFAAFICSSECRTSMIRFLRSSSLDAVAMLTAVPFIMLSISLMLSVP